MKILYSVKSGFLRTLKSWKGVLIIWLCFLILVAIVALPLRNSLNSAFGASMITEKLSEGFNLMAFTDLGPIFKSLLSFISGGFLIVILIGYIINAFLTGGLFRSLKSDGGRFSSSDFFGACAKNFWSFLIITLIISLIIIFVSGIIILIAMLIVSASESMPEKGIYNIAFGSIIIVLALVPVFLLVADYSRAWKISNSGSPFMALGFGFRHTFRHFWTSYATMLIMILSQVLFGLIVMFVIPSWKPDTGSGVFLLFIISQLLIYARLLLKTWRYGSITSLMEYNQDQIVQSGNKVL